MTPQSMSDYLVHLQAFSGWLDEWAPGAGSPAAITRTLLEDYMLLVRTTDLAAGTKSGRVSTLRMFLEEQREDGLAGLPPAAVIHVGEIPWQDYRLPRGLERRLFDQFVDPANLALLPFEQHRTVVLLLAYTACGCQASRRFRATRSRSAPTATPTCATATSSCAARR